MTQWLFMRLAMGVEPEAVVNARLDAVLEQEAALVSKFPLRAAIH